ncbi:MAG: methylmalonyl-CoA mutase family protein, partial [Hansschlegelia sp.]
MTNDTQATDFAAEFPATRDQWLSAAEAALKGRPLDTILTHRSIDGVAVQAIAERRAPRPIVGRAPGSPWTAMTRIDIGEPRAAGAQALEDLENGASGLSLRFASPDGDGPGLVADTLPRLEQALHGVMLDLAPIHLDAPGSDGVAAAALFAALVETRRHPPGDVEALFGLDLLRAGSAQPPAESAWALL